MSCGDVGFVMGQSVAGWLRVDRGNDKLCCINESSSQTRPTLCSFNHHLSQKLHDRAQQGHRKACIGEALHDVGHCIVVGLYRVGTTHPLRMSFCHIPFIQVHLAAGHKRHVVLIPQPRFPSSRGVERALQEPCVLLAHVCLWERGAAHTA